MFDGEVLRDLHNIHIKDKQFDDPLPYTTHLSFHSSAGRVLLQLLGWLFPCKENQHVPYLLVIVDRTHAIILYTTQITLIDCSHRYYK